MSAENVAPVCRGCYAATLTPAQRERFYAEPVTSCIYWCDDHQRAMDRVLNSLPQVQLIKASISAYEFPTFAAEPLPRLCDVRGDRCCGTPACENAGKWTEVQP